MFQKMTVVMVLLAFTLIALPSCEQKWDDEYRMPQSETVFRIVSSIPNDQTRQFPRTGKLIVHFNRALDVKSIRDAVVLTETNQNGAVSTLSTTVGVVGNNLYITPRFPLTPATNFSLLVKPLIKSVDGETIVAPEDGQTINFSTGQIRAQLGSPPEVTFVTPSPDDQYIFDFTNFRIYFSEPLDETSLRYGDTILVKNSAGQAISALMFAEGNQVVIDPKTDLEPDKTYTLLIKDDVTDQNGENLEEDFTREFTISDSKPHATLGVVMCPTMGDQSPQCVSETDPAALPLSNYTGDPSNSMIIDSALLGRNVVYISGKLVSEMGNPSVDSNFVPLVIRKGQKIYGKGIDAMLGGKIKTGYNTGDIEITLLTDAVGYLAGSDYIYEQEGDEIALLFTLDTAINTTSSNPATNAMMSQSILGVSLVGSARTEDGAMVMEVAGFTEMNVAGETIPSTMSMLMKSPEVAVTEVDKDIDPPILRSYTPWQGENSDRVRLTERIVGNFDEPLDMTSVQEHFWVQNSAGARIAGSVRVYGSRAVFIPEEPLLANWDYQMVFDAGISDIMGNARTNREVIDFKTGAEEVSESGNNPPNPPLLMTVFPGDNDAVTIPAHMPVVVCFNQLMEPTSIRLGETFEVLDLTEEFRTGQKTPVRGTIYYMWDHFIFEPDRFWTPNHNYRIVITDDITNLMDLALDLDGDRIAGASEGVDEFYVDFKAGQENRWVMLLLKLNPIVDTDGSGYVDGNEVPADVNTLSMNFLLFNDPSYATGYMVSLVKGLAQNEQNTPFMAVDIGDGTFLTASSVSPSLPFKSTEKGLLDPLGRISIDVIRTGSADIFQTNEGRAQMDVNMLTDFQMENNTFNSMIEHELGLSVKGDIIFTGDGRLQADISGRTIVKGLFHVPILGWDIPLRIPTDIKLRAVSEALTFY